MEGSDAPVDAARVRRTYWLLALLSTLAASFIWGINTLFLLDAGLEQRPGLRGQCLLHRRRGDFRDPDRRGGRHLGETRVVPARRGDAAGVDPALPRHVETSRLVPVLGGRLGAARPRLHVFLWGDRGLAGRRAGGRGRRRHARQGAGKGTGRDRCRDADRRGGRRSHRPGHGSRCSLRHPLGAAGPDLPGGRRVDEGSRFHPARRTSAGPRSGACYGPLSTTACAIRPCAG